jgi:hypothetical protein
MVVWVLPAQRITLRNSCLQCALGLWQYTRCCQGVCLHQPPCVLEGWHGVPSVWCGTSSADSVHLTALMAGAALDHGTRVHGICFAGAFDRPLVSALCVRPLRHCSGACHWSRHHTRESALQG